MNRGFTLIEIIVVVTVSIILFSFSYAIYSNFQKTQTIGAVRQDVVEAIRLTRQKAIAGVNGNDHGVYFSASRYVLFEGTTYLARIPSLDISFDLPSGYVFSGSDQLNFAQKTGSPSATGVVIITNTALSTTTSITVNGYGLIY